MCQERREDMKLNTPRLPEVLDPVEEEFDNFITNSRENEIDVEEKCITDIWEEGKDFTRLSFCRVVFRNCHFINCVFEKASFLDVVFENCDLSNSNFSDAYFHRCQIKYGKWMGVNLSNSILKHTEITEGNFKISNMDSTKFEYVFISETNMEHGNITSCKLKNVEFFHTDFTLASFFKTSLKAIDFTECTIDKITVSEELTELKGAIVNPYQAVELSRLLGVIIK